MVRSSLFPPDGPVHNFLKGRAMFSDRMFFENLDFVEAFRVPFGMYCRAVHLFQTSSFLIFSAFFQNGDLQVFNDVPPSVVSSLQGTFQ